MKIKNSSIILTLCLFFMSQLLRAECVNQPTNSIVDDQFKNLFEIKKKLTKLQCNEPEKLASMVESDSSGYINLRNRNAKSVPPEFIHDENHCKKVELCSNFVEFERAESYAKEIFNKKILQATFLKALWNERKNNPKTCGMEKLEPSCTQIIKEVYEVDDEKHLVTKVRENFKYRSSHLIESTTSNPESNCPTFKINTVCKDYTDRMNALHECEENLEKPGKDCYHDVQGAVFNLIKDNYKNEMLYWALEKELCRPTRIFIPIPDEVRFAQENPDFVGPVRSPQDDTGLELVPGASLAVKESSESNSFQRVVNNADARFGVNSNYQGLSKPDPKIGDFESNVAQETPKTDSVLNNFSNGLKVAYDSNSNLDKNTGGDPTANLGVNTNFSNFVNHSDNSEKDTDKDAHKSDENSSGNKKDEINALTAQIDSLNKKLSDMSSKLEELKANPKSKDDSAELEQNKANLQKEKAILELKNKIAELETQRKDLISKQAIQAELKPAQSSSDQPRAIASYSSPIASVNDYDDKPSMPQSAGNQQSYSPSSQNSGGDYARAPASSSNSISGGQLGGGIVLRSSGGQAGAAENSTVYLTQDEVKNYPYRLEANATDLDIEKMFKESNGAPVLLGESEQVVAVKENGKLTYKRGKIIVVKNEKVKKESISRAISSVADLKKDEEKKSRDYIRYQEMKKGLKLNK